jgi:hypothetical protein
VIGYNNNMFFKAKDNFFGGDFEDVGDVLV